MRRRVRRLPRKNFYSYLRPFLFLVVLVFLLYKGYSYFFEDSFFSSADVKGAEVSLYVEQGNAQILLWGEGVWDNAPDGVKLFQGDTIKTDGKSRVKLISFDQSIFRLDQKSRVSLDYLNNKNQNRVIRMNFFEGALWGEIERTQSADSEVEIQAPLFTVSSNGGTFNIENNAVRCLAGFGTVKIKAAENSDTILAETSIGVGQQVLVTPELLQELQSNPELEVLTALSEDFKLSDWYLWNQLKHGNIMAFEQNDEDESETDSDSAEGDELNADENTDENDEDKDPKDRISITSPAQKSVTDEKSITVKGIISDEQIIAVSVGQIEAEIRNTQFTASDVALDEGENTLPITVTTLDGKQEKIMTLTVTNDNEKPEKAKVTTPALSNGVAETDQAIQEIVGTVGGEDAYKVVVSYFENGAYTPYTLDKYVPGSKQFQYYAKEEYGNLKPGKNLYQIVVTDRAGNESDPVEITLNYTPQEKVEEETADDSAGNADAGEDVNTVTVESNAGLEITEPNGGTNVVISELPVFLRGTTSSKTSKIVVNGTTVSTYTAGNGLWAYKLDLSLGNIVEGQNEVSVEAFASDGASLGTDSMTIILKLDTILKPAITQPTGSATFQSTETDIILAGTCSSQTAQILVNGKAIVYTPGQTSWSTSVSLREGENIFRVEAEAKDGTRSDTADITISL